MTRPSLAPLLDTTGHVVALALDPREDPGRRLSASRVAALAGALSAAVGAVVLGAEDGPGSAGAGRPAWIVPLEDPDAALATGDERETVLRPSFGPSEAARLGAAATRLLVPMRPDNVAFAYRGLHVAAQAVVESHAAGLPAILEPVVYRVAAEPPEVFEARRRDLLVVAVAQLASVGPDLLVLPFPWVGDRTLYGAADVALEACTALHDAAAGVPWILHATGVDEAGLAWQLPVAGAAGASGVVVGKVAWGDAPDDEAALARWAEGVGRPRLERLASIARSTGVPLRG